MAQHHYPHIVTKDLIFYLDTSNPASFQGEPTTNLLSGSTNNFLTSPWYPYCGDYRNITGNTIDTLDPNGTYTSTKIKLGTTLTCTGNNDSWGILLNNASGYLSTGKTYTASIWAKGKNGGEIFYLGLNDANRGTFTLTTEWVRYTYTKVNPTTTDRGFQFTTFATGVTYYVWRAQLEEKNHATDWVDGTRNTTFYDLSSSHYDSTINNATSLQKNNVKTILFSGSSQTIVTPFYTNTYSNTWNAWVYCLGNTSTFNMFMGQFLPYFSFYNGSEIRFSCDVGGTQRTLSTTMPISLNTWYYVSFTTSYIPSAGITMQIFVNGKYQISTTNAGILILNDSNFLIGDGDSNNIPWYPFYGYVQQVSWYNRTLSETEILQNYNATKGKFQ